MLKLINKVKKYLFIIFILIILTLIYTLLGYNNIITLTTKMNKIVSMFLGSLFFFFISLSYCLQKNKHGLLNGLLISLILISFIVLLNISLKNQIKSISFLKYAIYIFSSIIGGIIGVNKSK